MEKNKGGDGIFIEVCAIVYILLIGTLCYILPVPEIIKGFLVLPALLIFYYLFGKTFIYMLSILLKKKDFLSDLNMMDSVSKFVLLWFFGFATLSFIFYFLRFLAMHVFPIQLGFIVHEYILKYLLLYIFIVVALFYFANILKNKNYYAYLHHIRNLKDVIKRKFSLVFVDLSVLGVDKKIILLFILFTISVVSMVKFFIPFPLFGPEFMAPLTIFQSSLRLLSDGFYPAGRYADVQFGSLGYLFFGADPLATTWCGIYLLVFLSLFGIYLFSYAISKSKNVSLLAAIFGTFFICVTPHSGQGITDSFRSGWFLLVLFPFMIFFIVQNLNLIERKKVTGNLNLLFVVGFVAVFFYSNGRTFFRSEPTMELEFWKIMGILVFAVLFVLILFKWIYKKNMFYGFFALLFFSYFIHEDEWIFFTFGIFLWYFIYSFTKRVKSINIYYNLKHKNNNALLQYKIICYLMVLFIFLTFLFFIVQDYNILKFDNKFHSIISKTIQHEGIEHYLSFDFRYKKWLIDKFTSPLIWQFVIISSVLTLLYLRKYLFIVTMLSVWVFLYIIPEGTTYRAIIYGAPFIGYLIGIMFWYVSVLLCGKKNPTTLPYIVSTLLILLLFASSISLLQDRYTPPDGYTYFPRFAEYEYRASKWIKKNLPENTGIISDWFTYITMAPLSNKVEWIKNDMNDNLSISTIEDKKKWQIIRKQIFGANNSKDACDGIQKLKEIPITNVLEDYYIKLKSAKDPTFKNISFVVVLSGRTERWFDTQDDPKYVLPGYIPIFSLEPVNPNSKYFKLFSDKRYFNLLYNDSDYIYVFKVNCREKN